MATGDPVLGVKGQMVEARPDGGLRPTKGRPPVLAPVAIRGCF